MLILGIDEAGRGPVIGPMVMAGYALEDSEIKKLKPMGVKDSKLLSPKKREELYKELIPLHNKHKIIILPPSKIDDSLNSDTSNLNLLETTVTASIINEIRPDRVIIDCPSINEESYTRTLKKYLTHKCEIIAEHKADLNYPIVGAASILAKVTRDREIKKIEHMIHKTIGSGYPADPRTQKFLKENYKDPKLSFIFRKTWSTYKNLIKKEKQKTLNNL
ncbi:MAG: ribonuclease HII [Nitrospiraceae bacterium]|nr:ribonuclease HII [Nitrospiraceae bacterium]